MHRTIDDDIREDLYKEKERLILQLARLLNRIRSDIFQKEPHGQVPLGQEIKWKRCIELLSEVDKARELIEEVCDFPDNVYNICEIEK